MILHPPPQAPLCRFVVRVRQGWPGGDPHRQVEIEGGQKEGGNLITEQARATLCQLRESRFGFDPWTQLSRK